MRLAARGHIFEFPRRPLIMGIVNLVADSFSGDGTTDIDAALTKARQMVADGADFVDIGAESARTNRGPISEDEEAGQLLRFIERWEEATPLSINTWRPAVVRAVLPRGGALLNDIGGLATDENARICADTGAALLIMHTVGEPKVPHTHVQHPDIMAALEEFFTKRLELAAKAGLPADATVLDPGIDFAKQKEDNLRIYRELNRLHRFGRPILLPVSRKTVIGDILGLAAPDRDAGSVACLVNGMLRGAQIFRVHNVQAATQSAQIIGAAVAGSLQ
jgi:dihydropteroate synthase